MRGGEFGKAAFQDNNAIMDSMQRVAHGLKNGNKSTLIGMFNAKLRFDLRANLDSYPFRANLDSYTISR